MVQTALGFVTNFVAGFLVYPLVGMPMPAASNLIVTALFTILSLKRGYWLRRFFVWFWARKERRAPASLPGANRNGRQ
ncbi:MAG TPA: hypothetical protein VF798_12075 [Burkholderiaceae bacterium]